MKYYMHTIENRPAYFSVSDDQIVYAGRRAVDLATSLRQIRREQQTTIRNRLKWFGPDAAADKPNKYGYVRIDIP